MPLGYTTYYGGSFQYLAVQQSVMAAQEEAFPEGTLVLVELTLAEPATPETLAELNVRLMGAGVPPWEGYSDIVLADTADAGKVYACWTKGMAWSGIVIGILLLLLPTILGGIIWFLIPQGIKDSLLMMALVAIMLPMMGMVMKEK